MSVHISSWVWRESNARGTDLLVLLALADQANDDGECWPSQKTIAERTRLSRATVQRCIDAAVEHGEIAVQSRTGASNRYVFTHLNPPQNEAGFEGVPQIEAPHNCEAGGASPVGQGCLTVEAQNHQEPSMNRKSAPRSNSKATQFPKNFTFADVRDWTIAGAFPVGADDFEEFRDWHTSKGSTFKDWRAAWRTWARKAKRWNGDRERADESRDSYGGAAYGVGVFS